MSISNFNNTTPAAPSGNTNVTWQKSGDLISGYVPDSTSPLTTKGDLFGFDTAADRIPVGTDGDVLTADSGAALGVSWQPAGGGGGGGLVLLETETAGGSTSNIPCTTRNASGQSGNTFQTDFDEYLIEVSGLINGSSAQVGIQTHASGSFDTGSNYAWQLTYSDAGGVGFQSNSGDTALNWFASGTTPATSLSWVATFRLYNPAATALFPQFVGNICNPYSGASVMHKIDWGGYHKSLTGIDGFRIIASAGNITAGTIRIYGISK